MMEVCFYANLRAITSRATINLNEPRLGTLSQLIGYLIKLYPEIRSHLLSAEGDLRPDVPIFVNGRNPRLEMIGLDITLQPDDVISIFSPIASGKMNVEAMRAATLGDPERV